MRTVELIGLPGAGKSTIISFLDAADRSIPFVIGELGKRRLHLPWKGGAQRAGAATAAIVLQPRLLRELGNYAIATGAVSSIGLTCVRRTLQAAHAIDGANGEKRNDVLVLDQGLLQFLASIAISGHRSAPPTKHLVSLLVGSRIEGIVWVDTPQETAFERLRARSHGASRLDRMDLVAIGETYRRFSEVLIAGRDLAEEIGIPLLSLDGSSPPSANATAIKSWLALRSGDRA